MPKFQRTLRLWQRTRCDIMPRMKISEYGSVRNTAAARKKAGAGGVAGNFSDLVSLGEESPIAATREMAAVVPLQSLLGLQEVSDAEVSRKAAVRHGNSLLDSLEQLRHSLLIGRMPLDVLRTLESRLQRQRELTADPALHALIDDIELRAAVELAKIEWALAQKEPPEGA